MTAPKIIDNRRARYDYHLGEKIVAGIVLSGAEVVNIRNQRVSLKNAFVNIKDGDAYLHNLQIFTLKDQSPSSLKQTSHRLLLTKPQIRKLENELESKNSTVVPTRLISGRYIKIEIAPAKGKKQFDKREVIKKRQSDLSIKRQLKKNPGSGSQND